MALETVQLRTATGAYAYIAGDLIGSSFIPITKIDLGADGISLPVSGTIPVALSAPLPAGTANIGDVDVLSLPSLPAGTAAIGKLAANSGVDIGDVDVTSSALPTGAATSANQSSEISLLTSIANINNTVLNKASAAGSYQPMLVPGYIRDDVLTVISTAVDEGEADYGRIDGYGAHWVQLAGALDSNIDSVSIKAPSSQTWKSYNSTSSLGAGSAAILWTPASGKKIVITSYVISTYGTTGARIFLFFAANADLTYTAGTDQPVFVGSFAPSTTSKPGVARSLVTPIVAGTADYKLLYQNDAAISIDITVYGYEI